MCFRKKKWVFVWLVIRFNLASLHFGFALKITNNICHIYALIAILNEWKLTHEMHFKQWATLSTFLRKRLSFIIYMYIAHARFNHTFKRFNSTKWFRKSVNQSAKKKIMENLMSLHIFIPKCVPVDYQIWNKTKNAIKANVVWMFENKKHNRRTHKWSTKIGSIEVRHTYRANWMNEKKNDWMNIWSEWLTFGTGQQQRRQWNK